MDDPILERSNAIRRFQILTLISGLKLEIKGMTKRGKSCYSICKSKYGLKGSRESVLKQMQDIVEGM